MIVIMPYRHASLARKGSNGGDGAVQRCLCKGATLVGYMKAGRPGFGIIEQADEVLRETFDCTMLHTLQHAFHAKVRCQEASKRWRYFIFAEEEKERCVWKLPALPMTSQALQTYISIVGRPLQSTFNRVIASFSLRAAIDSSNLIK